MRRGRAAAWAALGLLALAFRFRPEFAGAWARHFSGPALRLLNGWTGRLPFPLAEPLAALAALCALAGRPRRWRAGIALLLAAGCALLWLPGVARVGAAALPEPGADALEALCLELVDALDGAAPAFPAPAESLALAPGVAGLPGGAVKAALFPEWMRMLRVAGVAVPWTGEAVVDGSAAPALIPFTAVHELMHVSGVADEGAANIAAWEKCVRAGGSFADSARLWALRYAAGMLAEADEGRCARVLGGMGPELARLWGELGGVLPPGGGLIRVGSYHDLVRRLVAEPGMLRLSAPASARTS